MTVEVVEQSREQRNILFKTYSLSNFDQVLFADAPVLRIVQQEVGQFPALLDEVDVGQPGDSLLEAGDVEQFAQYDSGIVETQRLIEVRRSRRPRREAWRPELVAGEQILLY